MKRERRLGSIAAYETYWAVELELHGGDIRRIESQTSQGLSIISSLPEVLLTRMCHGLFDARPGVFENAKVFLHEGQKKLRVVVPRSASDAEAVYKDLSCLQGSVQIRGEGTNGYTKPPVEEPEGDWEEWEEVSDE